MKNLFPIMAQLRSRRLRDAVRGIRPYTGYEGTTVQISEREEVLLEAFRRLPAETAMELSALAERLATSPPGTTIDWSDSWSDEDLREYTAASLRRFEDEEQEEPR
jgi:hypothetical protein